MTTSKPSTSPHRLARTIASSAIGVAMLVALGVTASAHAGLESSDPTAGEVLASAPTSVTMSFTEPPDPDLSSVTVLDASGAEIETGPLERGSAPRSLEVALPSDLDDGVYTVSWRVVSTADGHLTAGAFAFGVGTPSSEVAAAPEASAPSTPAPSPLAVAGKVLLYAGLAVSIGATATGLMAFNGVVPARRVLLPLASTSALGGAVAMTIAEADVVGATIGDLLSSAAGRSYAWLLGTTAITLVASFVASRSPSRRALVVLGLSAAAAMLVRATSGHAAALVPALPAEIAQWVHFLAIGIWIGGLLPLLLLVRERRTAATPAPVGEVIRFSRIAGWALLVVVLTGIARTVGEAGGIGAVRTMLADTSYGTTLVVKVSIAFLLIGLGALNRRRSIPRLERDGTLLRQVATIELVAALGVFGLTGVLTGLNPDPAETPSSPARPSVSASGADFATTTRVTFTAEPGSAGPNTFVARIVDYDEGTPLQADEVTVLMAAIGRPEIEPATLPMEPGETAHSGATSVWTGAGTQLSLAGAWDLVVQVRTGARTTEVPLILVTRAPPTTSVVAQSSGELPDIETFTTPTGEQLQLYLDPGAAGTNEFHVTAFGRAGRELPLSGLVVVAVGPDGTAEALDVTRLTPGHFAAPVEIGAGRWRFQVVATTEGGTVLQANQDQEIA
jgi:copper transport protein